MKDEQFLEISEKMDLLIRLFASQLVIDKDYREQVTILSGLGLKPKLIADITGKTTNNVKVTLHHIKKGNKSK